MFEKLRRVKFLTITLSLKDIGLGLKSPSPAQHYSIVMRTITLHTIHVGVLENYTKSNNITKLLTEL